MNSFTENACANFLASLNMSDAGIIPFDFTAFDEIITESMYDSIFKYDNPARKGNNRKAKGNGKRNFSKTKRLHEADRKHGKHRELSRKEENGVHGWKSGIIYSFRGNRIVPVGKTDRGYHKNRYSKKERDFMTCMPETVPFYELNTDEDFRLDYAYRTWMEEQAEKEREEKYRFDDYGFLDYDYDFYDSYDIW